ncbi:beta/gamma crystallin domain-containing protein 2-like [Heptranchias perlo]|uniref:beta/gamma crystallin domain-containing protein 2-like n=1 Tax=Heptranchias perlo TaxID=212740 RepID=UPI0035598C68
MDQCPIKRRVSEQTECRDWESLDVPEPQSPDKLTPHTAAKTKYDIIITLSKEAGWGEVTGGDAGGLVSGERMAERSADQVKPGGPEEKPESPVQPLNPEECRRLGTPLSGAGAGAGGEVATHLGAETTAFPPRPDSLNPGQRDPGHSPSVNQQHSQTESKVDLHKLASSSGPLQEAGGSQINQDNTRKVGGDKAETMSTSTDSQVGADRPLSIYNMSVLHTPSQIAGSPHILHTSSSTMQQNSNGSDPTPRDERNSDTVLTLSENARQSSVEANTGSCGSMNSVLYVGLIGSVQTEQPSKEPGFVRGDGLQKVSLSGYMQQINTLNQQSSGQNGLISKTLHSPTDEESVSEKLKLDQVPRPQMVGNSLLNPQNVSLQDPIKSPIDSFKIHTPESSVLNSKDTLVQNPTEDSKNFQVESSIGVTPKPQEQTLKFTSEKRGHEERGEKYLQPTGSPTLENELSSNDIFIQNQSKERPTNVSDDPESLSEIDGFVDTIRNLDAPMLTRRNKGPRTQKPHSFTSFSTLPPIEEDQANPKNPLSSSITEKPQLPSDTTTIDGKPLPCLPTQSVAPISRMDFSKIITKKEILTPGQMMKMQLEDKPRIGAQRASAESSIVFQSNLPGSPNLEFNGNSESKDPLGGESKWSRIGSSLLYSGYKKPLASFSSRSLDLNTKSTNTSPTSGPSTTLSNLTRRSLSQEDVSTAAAAVDQLLTPTFLTSSVEGSLDTRRFNLPSSISDMLTTGYPSLSDSATSPQSNRISLPSDLYHHTTANRKPGKVTAFPDAWKSKPKEQGKINPRPGKIVIYDKPNFSGFKREINCDVSDCLSWNFPPVISIRVIRGCWVAYKKPDYKGKKFMFAEEDVELVNPWSEEIEEETEDPDSKPAPTKPIVIGSLRRAVRDYTIPQISLFPDTNGEGKKLTFYDESEDIRIFGYPLRTSSIVVNSGLWLVYCAPFFEGRECALEVGGYRTLAEWGGEKAQVGSLVPLQMGPPRVEKPYEPKVGIFERPCFVGRSREVYGDSSDFLSRYPNNGAPLSNASSIKVYGGIWIGYAKEGFRGHQYLLEEGEYLDWRSWGGYDEDLKSLRLIRADFSNPRIVLYGENINEEESSITVIGSVPDLEQADSGDIIQSINVLNGVWVAYESSNYSGAQYILEKGIYRNPQDWGAQNCKISSLHPILLVEADGQPIRLKIQLFSEYDFSGRCLVIEESKMGIPKEFKAQSCRVLNGSWALYEGQDYTGRVFVVGEGEYPDLPSMGCRMTTHIRCIKAVPRVFSEPAITLHSLENFEGKEIELDSEVKNLISNGYNNLILSLRVCGGVWVVYEHSNFRGRQVLLEPIEIPNWPKYSSFSRIGSLSPVLQKRAFFQIKNKETNSLLSVAGGQEDIKSIRVILAPENKELSQLWFYESGLLKPKFAPDMSLQTIGVMGATGSKVVLWSDSRIPKHCWTFEFSGTVQSLMYEGFVLDVKGGKSYDRDSAMICRRDEENQTQLWEIQML